MSMLNERNERNEYHVRSYTAMEDCKLDAVGDRIIVLRWKDTKNDDGSKTPKMSDPLYLSVPAIQFSVTPDTLAKALRSAVEDMQDACAKDNVAEQLSRGIKQQDITVLASALTAPGIATWQQETVSTGRINKKDVEAWFSANLQDHLVSALRKKLGVVGDMTDIERKKVIAATVQYRDKLSSLSGPVQYSKNIALQLTECLCIAPENVLQGKVPEYLMERLNKFVRAEDNDLMSL